MRAVHFSLIVFVLCLSPVASNGQRRPSRQPEPRTPIVIQLQSLDNYEGRAWLKVRCDTTEAGLRRLHCTFEQTSIAAPRAPRVAPEMEETRARLRRVTPAEFASFRRNCSTELARQAAGVQAAPPARRADLARTLELHRTTCAAVTREQWADAMVAFEFAVYFDRSCSILRNEFEVDFVRVRPNMWVTANLTPNHCGIVTTTTLTFGPRDDQWLFTQSRSTGGSTDGVCSALEQGGTQTYSTEGRGPVTLPCTEIGGAY